MLTGDPRTATVRAVDDVQVLEIAAADMRLLAQSTPGLLEHISKVVSTRRAGLAQAEATAAAAAAEQMQAPQTLSRESRPTCNSEIVVDVVILWRAIRQIRSRSRDQQI